MKMKMKIWWCICVCSCVCDFCIHRINLHQFIIRNREMSDKNERKTMSSVKNRSPKKKNQQRRWDIQKMLSGFVGQTVGSFEIHAVFIICSQLNLFFSYMRWWIRRFSWACCEFFSAMECCHFCAHKNTCIHIITHPTLKWFDAKLDGKIPNWVIKICKI